MQTAVDRMHSLLVLARQTNMKGIRSALLIVALIAVLLWETRWPSLQTGLAILLCGQLATALLRVYHNTALTQQLEQLGQNPPGQDRSNRWFDSEISFIRNVGLIENGSRLLGFLVLAYGFWVATHRLLIALILGVVYPLTVYFGMTRRSTQRMITRLNTQRSELRTLLMNDERVNGY